MLKAYLYKLITTAITNNLNNILYNITIRFISPLNTTITLAFKELIGIIAYINNILKAILATTTNNYT